MTTRQMTLGSQSFEGWKMSHLILSVRLSVTSEVPRSQPEPLEVEATTTMTNRGLNPEKALSIDTGFLEGRLNVTPLVGSQDVRIEEGRVTMLKVPPDELCFNHCIAACRDVATWAAEHDRSSFALTPTLQMRTNAVQMKYEWSSSCGIQGLLPCQRVRLGGYEVLV